MIVRIYKYWSQPDLLQQTPARSGIWRGHKFFVDEPGEADVVVVHGHVGVDWKRVFEVTAPRENVWLILGEPPNEFTASWNNAPKRYTKIFTSDDRQSSPRHVVGNCMLPWWVSKSYDELRAMAPIAKSADLSWVTSTLTSTEGHRRRMAYYDRIRHTPGLHMFGRGFNPVADKWEGLAEFRYSIAFENFSNTCYWTEKIMDVYLAWGMPIYFGCTNLSRWFPAKSFVQLDPNHPDPVGFLREVTAGGQRERNLDAIAEARRRVLDDYNLFELIVRQIEHADVNTQSKVRMLMRDPVPSLHGRAYGFARSLAGRAMRAVGLKTRSG
jgi:hypothetical protein